MEPIHVTNSWQTKRFAISVSDSGYEQGDKCAVREGSVCGPLDSRNLCCLGMADKPEFVFPAVLFASIVRVWAVWPRGAAVKVSWSGRKTIWHASLFILG